MENSYDYIIAGSGLAGLSLLHRILLEEKLSEKSILVIDSTKKNKNDRTWCFWEKGQGIFEPIVHFEWKTLRFLAPEISETFSLKDYSYKMILGDDFYRYVLTGASKKANVKFVTTKISKINSKGSHATVETEAGEFQAEYVFNSTGLFFPEVNEKNTLLQHFLGWKIKVNTPTFDPQKATLMDFTLDQKHGTTFMYVLPTNPNEALVEYTLFTERVLERNEYEQAIKKYIREDLGIQEYEITHDEFGIIPMTLAPFERSEGSHDRIINLGTAGGFTKASTGYTFYFVQKHLTKLVSRMVHGKSPLVPRTFSDKKYDWYDRTLLDVLLTKKMEGRDVFSKLFTKIDPEAVLSFLANESSELTELKIRHSVPVLAFVTSGIRQLFYRG